MLGVGGLIAVPFTQRFGRLPVLWWSMFMSLFMTLFATLAPNNVAFIVARCLQGLFTTPPQCIGLSFIHDMYLSLPLSSCLPPISFPPFCVSHRFVFPHPHQFASLTMLPYLYTPTTRSPLVPQLSCLRLYS